MDSVWGFYRSRLTGARYGLVEFTTYTHWPYAWLETEEGEVFRVRMQAFHDHFEFVDARFR